VICLKHRIRCCSQAREDEKVKKGDGSNVTEYSWRAPKSAGVTCWDKGHNFYIPQGLFMDKASPMKEDDIASGNLKDLKFQFIRVGSDLNKKKWEALDFTPKRKTKKPKMTTATTHEVKPSRKESDDDGIDGLGSFADV
jgi:hypothetical protein